MPIEIDFRGIDCETCNDSTKGLQDKVTHLQILQRRLWIIRKLFRNYHLNVVIIELQFHVFHHL